MTNARPHRARSVPRRSAPLSRVNACESVPRPCVVAALKAVDKVSEKSEDDEVGEGGEGGGSSDEEEYSEEVYMAAKAEVEVTTRAAVEAVEKAGTWPIPGAVYSHKHTFYRSS